MFPSLISVKTKQTKNTTTLFRKLISSIQHFSLHQPEKVFKKIVTLIFQSHYQK